LDYYSPQGRDVGIDKCNSWPILTEFVV